MTAFVKAAFISTVRPAQTEGSNCRRFSSQKLEPLHISEGGYFEGHNDQQKGKCIYHYRLSPGTCEQRSRVSCTYSGKG